MAAHPPAPEVAGTLDHGEGTRPETRAASLRGVGTGRAALLLVAIAVVTGPRFADEALLIQLHTDPFRPLEEVRRYLHASLVNIFVGHALGAVSLGRVQALSVTATALALGAVLLYGHRAIADPRQRWTFFRLLALSPLIHVLMFWMGKSDPYLVVAYLLLLLMRDRVGVAALALVMTLAHPEQAAVVLAVHAVLYRPGPTLLLALLVGWGVGMGVHQAYLAQIGMSGWPRGSWIAARLDLPPRTNFVRPVSMLWLSFSWFWIPLLVYAKGRPGWKLPALAGLCFMVAAASADFTRVFTLLSLPLIVHIARELARADGGVLRPWLGRLTALGFLQMEIALGRIWDNGWTLILVEAFGIRLPR